MQWYTYRILPTGRDRKKQEDSMRVIQGFTFFQGDGEIIGGDYTEKLFSSSFTE
jgi:hypothetical protein